MKLFESFTEVVECYGKENLVPITNIKQIIFYARMNVQPKWILESEKNKGHIVCYYFKPESEVCYRKWTENRPVNQKVSV